MGQQRPGPERLPVRTRRRFLAGGAAFAVATAAGCIGGGNPDDDEGDGDGNAAAAGDDSSRDAEPGVDFTGVSPEGTSWEELPDLEGSLHIYSGRSEHQIDPIIRAIEDEYDGFSVDVRYEDNEALVARIDEEGQNTPADILYTQDSGTLGALARMGRTVELGADIRETVPSSWRDPDGTWTGVSGRTRCVAYNTDAWSADELPDDIFAFPADERFEDEMGWRVDSGSFLAFVRAMMIENGEDRARAFIEDMQAAGITSYEGGSTTPEAVASGEVTVGFVNQYYVGRLLADRPDEPIAVTFTDGDVGSLFNVSGTGVVDASENQQLAEHFVRHLLATEGQELFVDLNKEYAVIPSVEYVGDLPSLDELNPPEFDLNQLADIEPAVDLLRETGLR